MKINHYWGIFSGTSKASEAHGIVGPCESEAEALTDGREEWGIPMPVIVSAFEVCGGCMEAGESASDAGAPENRYAGMMLCFDCLDGYQEQDQDCMERGDYYDDGHGYHSDFADPGGNSALRAATDDNPRNLPCPSCGREDMLTPADRQRGYQCDRCADRAEHGLDCY